MSGKRDTGHFGGNENGFYADYNEDEEHEQLLQGE
jgi:hypothetical protein